MHKVYILQASSIKKALFAIENEKEMMYNGDIILGGK